LGRNDNISKASRWGWFLPADEGFGFAGSYNGFSVIFVQATTCGSVPSYTRSIPRIPARLRKKRTELSFSISENIAAVNGTPAPCPKEDFIHGLPNFRHILPDEEEFLKEYGMIAVTKKRLLDAIQSCKGDTVVLFFNAMKEGSDLLRGDVSSPFGLAVGNCENRAHYDFFNVSLHGARQPGTNLPTDLARFLARIKNAFLKSGNNIINT
jgi:hypothetical protein